MSDAAHPPAAGGGGKKNVAAAVFLILLALGVGFHVLGPGFGILGDGIGHFIEAIERAITSNGNAMSLLSLFCIGLVGAAVILAIRSL